MFESQHEWFDHELRFHRAQWKCRYCQGSPTVSRPELESHLEENHISNETAQEIDALIDQCRIERIDASICPLCSDYGENLFRINRSMKCDVSLKQFQSHLGGHMEQLALAALPLEEPEDNAYEDEDWISEDVEKTEDDTQEHEDKIPDDVENDISDVDSLHDSVDGDSTGARSSQVPTTPGHVDGRMRPPDFSELWIQQLRRNRKKYSCIFCKEQSIFTSTDNLWSHASSIHSSRLPAAEDNEACEIFRRNFEAECEDAYKKYVQANSPPISSLYPQSSRPRN